ncbi:hypothetical protein JFU18_03300 [Bacillus sp. TH22]|uniref:hypothetical protein n=1 Tax=Bacillus TaxID=1386 RepID=UPI0014850F03|nr:MULTISPECIES: hypothetical protein [Bacillus]MBK5359347.1 hypothetical protein [Bacillus sp. TH44]MBT2577943.1 hypothetical protein [Bacillus sp. ISL-8]MBK5345889.1 hypothetical protein [Bacillus sp. TH45]MBK5367213.1 hypothetical protein [Bacillus sp. TH50]MBK5447700.1 hypothetical protein [Bacillus sp. TH22]
MKVVTVNEDATIHVGILKGMTGCVIGYDADTGMAEIELDPFTTVMIRSEFLLQ